MRNESTFSVRINDGHEQKLTCRTGIYQEAAVAAIAILEYEDKDDSFPIVEIWVPDLLPDYKPLIFEIGDNEFGQLVVRQMVRTT